MPASDGLLITDGSVDWSGGVDSLKVPSEATPSNPNGLPTNMLAWLVNATVRGGGITQRNGWLSKGTIVSPAALFQGAAKYVPGTGNPYFLVSIAGNIWQVDPDFASPPVNLSAQFAGTTNPATQPQSYFCQAEIFMIIQAGDLSTKPLFWDGATLRRSNGLTGSTTYPNINELPAAGPMDYYMGRLWYAAGGILTAGDIVGNTASGTVPYSFTDSVLKVTENPLAIGGDGFRLPTAVGNIRAVAHSANLNTQLGQGTLYLGTPKAIYSLQVPVTRADWINANASQQPVLTVAQLDNGFVGERSVVVVNGDLFYQSLEPAVRSLIVAVRNFGQWANTAISTNEQRILRFADRSLLKLSTGIEFDNQLLQSTLPQQTAYGVVHTAIMPLDFAPLSAFESQAQPVWGGHWEGLSYFQLLLANFGGLDRAFAVVLGQAGTIDLWEITNSALFDAADSRVNWQIEFPAFNWQREWDLKKLVAGEIWVDRLYGTVDFTMEYRPDGDPCWKMWHQWQACSARNSCEDVTNPVCYPLTPYAEGFRSTMTLPMPPQGCGSTTGRPANVAFQIQPRLTIKGFCRVRGLLLHAEPVSRRLWPDPVC